MEYREPYPAWMLVGMDALAAGILVASFRDAWWVVQSLGEHSGDLLNSIVAGAVVLAIDASILLLEQARSQVKLRGGRTKYNDIWVMALIVLSAMLNVRYLAATGDLMDRCIGAVLGVAIPSTIAVLGYLKGDMLAYNAQQRQRSAEPEPEKLAPPRSAPASADDEPMSPMFRLKRPRERSADRPVAVAAE